MMKNDSLWYGLVEVRPKPMNADLSHVKGAHFKMVTWATDSKSFRKKAEFLCRDMQLFLVGIEDESPIEALLASVGLDEELEDLTERAKDNPDAIIFGAFYTWVQDDRM